MTKPLYRVGVYDQNGIFLKADPTTEFYTAAHLGSHDYNDTYPEQTGIVERSLDNGQTWTEYDADEIIDGAPAWVSHLRQWRNHNK